MYFTYSTSSCHPTRKKKTIESGKTHMRRYFTQESIDAFMHHAETDAQWVEHMNKRSQNKEYHPIIALIGSNMEAPAKILVCFEDKKYMMPSLPKAVSVCFKIFHVFGIQYPITCENVWHFINQ